MKQLLGVFMIAASLVFAACGKDDNSSSNNNNNNNNSVSCSGVTATYAATASPVFVSKCATNSSCHATGASNSGGVLTTHAQISARKDNIRAAVLNGSMPRGTTLTTQEKQAIICWIDAGALNN